jgi:tRNA A37 threonylcarbamoyladenosine biosynthesis protein TsaE
MSIVVVEGSAKGAGKTTLVCGLIAALDRLRWTAVKSTLSNSTESQQR